MATDCLLNISLGVKYYFKNYFKISRECEWGSNIAQSADIWNSKEISLRIFNRIIILKNM